MSPTPVAWPVVPGPCYRTLAKPPSRTLARRGLVPPRRHPRRRPRPCPPPPRRRPQRLRPPRRASCEPGRRSRARGQSPRRSARRVQRGAASEPSPGGALLSTYGEARNARAAEAPRSSRPRAPLPTCRDPRPCSSPSSSPRLWEAEVDLARRRVGPARGDDLSASVEVDPLRPVDVRVAEETAFPAAERVIRDGNRDRDIDADHPNLDLVLELPGGAAVAREDRDAVAVLILVHELDRLVVGPGSDDREHRSEDLVLVRIHLGRDLVQQGHAEEEAVAV